MMRLDKFLGHMGIGTRKEIKDYAKKGLITVNGSLVKNTDLKIDENKDIITFDGEELHYEEFVYFMMNKPAGVVSATWDNKSKTVIDLIDDYKHLELFPFGRLDKDSEGLLIISNDGKLAHELLSPKKHVDKKYYVDVEGIVTNDDVIKFKEGITIDGDELCKPALLEIIESNSISKCYVTISEGKFHQVKRMFEAVNKKVIYLKRITFGNIELDTSIKLGEYRKLTKEEIEKIKN
jgi:16S rRNA pseudouridine516 synthase